MVSVNVVMVNENFDSLALRTLILEDDGDKSHQNRGQKSPKSHDSMQMTYQRCQYVIRLCCKRCHMLQKGRFKTLLAAKRANFPLHVM